MRPDAGGSLTRRGFLRAAGMLGAGAAATAMLPQPGFAATQKRGGVLPLSAPLLAGTLDPIYFRTPIELTYAWPAYNALVEGNPIDLNKIGPGLAASWTVSGDGMTYTFKLQHGVQFHDGSPFTSADVKYTYEAVLNPPPGRVSQRKSTVQVIESTSTPDPYTVVIKTKYPSASFIPGIASIPILPQQAHAKGPFDDTAIGTGPFKCIGFDRDVQVAYARNEKYWRKGLPYLDGVRYFFITDATARLDALRTGRVDWDAPLGDTAVKVLGQQYASTIDLTNLRRLNVGALLFNHTTPNAPWRDKRVREAFSLAIDRQELLNAVWGGRGDIIGVMPNVGGWALPPQDLAKYPGYSGDKASKIAQAKALLADAGHPNGFSVHAAADTTYLGDMILFCQAALKPIGVNIELTSVDTPTVSKDLTSGNFEVIVDTIPTALADPDEQLSLYVTGQTLNYGQYSNPKIDDMYKQQSTTLDQTKRKQIVLDMQRILMDDMPLLMLLGRVDVMGVNKVVQDFHLDPSFHFHFTDARERVWLNT